MMQDAKYVRLEENDAILVFPSFLSHVDFQRVTVNDPVRGNVTLRPISAGFIAFGQDKDGNIICSCYGSSHSLGLDSREEDAFLASRQIAKDM